MSHLREAIIETEAILDVPKGDIFLAKTGRHMQTPARAIPSWSLRNQVSSIYSDSDDGAGMIIQLHSPALILSSGPIDSLNLNLQHDAGRTYS